MVSVPFNYWTWLVVLAVVVLLVLAGSGGRRRSPRGHRPRELDPSDEQAVNDMFSRVDAEARQARLLDHLTDELDRLIARRTPLRVVGTAPRSGLVRLGFADSTVLVARASNPTELAVLGLVVSDQHVVPISYTVQPEGPRLLLGWGSGTLTALVVGSDQAD